jgi:protein-S-isoprenylcysteine O-methyltransferase Ste14
MWIVRFALVGSLFVFVLVGRHVLRHRTRYQRCLESGPFNYLLVIAYQLLCYLAVGLPSEPDRGSEAAFFTDPLARTGLSVVGLLLIASAVLVYVIALRQRKVLGGQDVEAGLLVSGAYRFFRHPLYTAVVWISLGLPLVTRNVDGLIAFPAVLLANVAQAAVEESCDVGVRFRAEYKEYRKGTRMLGPVWLWAGLLAILLALMGVAYLP